MTDNVPAPESEQIPAEQYKEAPTADTPSTDTPEPEEAETPEVDVEVTVDPKMMTENKDPNFPSNEALALVAANATLLQAQLSTEQLERLANSRDISEWAQVMMEASRAYLRGDAFLPAVNRDKSRWANHVKTDERTLGISRPGADISADSQGRLTGDNAVMRARMLANMGDFMRIPLWHTGIYVTIKTPSNLALAELEERIAREKVVLGRDTAGMIFSNTSVYITHHLVDMILDHVYDSSIKDATKEMLKQTILITDIPALVHGALTAIYPKTYPLASSCIADPRECTHVTHQDVRLAKLLWVDNNALTAKQKKHMTRVNSKFTPDEIKAYQQEHQYHEKAIMTINAAIRARMAPPTIAAYEQAGFDWVQGIIDATDDAFGTKLTGQEREDYILRQGRASYLRQYSHWFSEILMESGDENNPVTETVDGRTEIENITADFSEIPELCDQILTDIGQFISDSSIAVVGFPTYVCPSCGKPQPTASKRYPELIPLDINHIFFTLTARRLAKVYNLASM